MSGSGNTGRWMNGGKPCFSCTAIARDPCPCGCPTCLAKKATLELASQDLKKDAGKVRFELVDPFFLLEVAKVLTKGAEKYAAEKWREGISYQRIIGAMERHLNAIKRGEDVDPEWGLLHAAHLACEAMFIGCFARLGRTDLDDRVKK